MAAGPQMRLDLAKLEAKYHIFCLAGTCWYIPNHASDKKCSQSISFTFQWFKGDKSSKANDKGHDHGYIVLP